MQLPHIKDVDVAGKRIFLRCDLNVPINEWGTIVDDTRIKASLKTINHLLENKAKLIISSHLGRPKGEVDPDYSLSPVARNLSEKLGFDVPLIEDYFEGDIPDALANIEDGKAVLLENLRFHAGETGNDPEFAKRLASFADIYVNDAFGTCHRAHASVSGVPALLPHYAGFLIFDEVANLSKLLQLDDSQKPFVAILGGGKVSGKIRVIESLFDKVDTLLLGGGLAFTFLKANGHSVGRSLVEDDFIGEVDGLMKRAEEAGVKIELPDDLVIAEDNSEEAEWKISGVDIEDPLWMGLDIGPKTVNKFRGYLVNAKSVFINGPMGVYEYEPFENGTKDILQVIASSMAFSVIGGGDIVAAAEKYHLTPRFTHVSTGGGASLEFLSGVELPGIAALKA
jgi:3-phosphoglycerate kinase